MKTYRYGITEKKQEELNLLTDQVLTAENNVNEVQAIVNSLTQKSQEFQNFFENAQTNKETALTNLKLFTDVLNQVKDVVNNSTVVSSKTQKADTTMLQASKDLSILIERLIFSAEFINRLGQVIIKNKTQVPLISGQLIKIMSTAATDANNAVATTLTALQSSYAASASSRESLEITALELTQSRQLQEHLLGQDLEEGSDNVSESVTKVETALKALSTVAATITSLKALKDTATANVVSQDAKISTIENDIKNSRSQIKVTIMIAAEIEHALEELDHEQLRVSSNIARLQEELEETSDPLIQHTLQGKIEQYEVELGGLELSHDEIVNKNTENAKEKRRLETAIKKNERALATDRAALVNLQTEEEVALTNLAAENVVLAQQPQLALDQAFNELNEKLISIALTADGKKKDSLEYLITTAYSTAVQKYDKELKAYNAVTQELDVAEAKLVTATNTLSSLKAGLEAATAAALAA